MVNAGVTPRQPINQTNEDTMQQATTERKRLLLPQEVAEVLSVHRRTVDRWTKEGRLPTVRLSDKIIRFREEDVETFVQESISR